MDGRPIAYTRYSLYAVACKKTAVLLFNKNFYNFFAFIKEQ